MVKKNASSLRLLVGSSIGNIVEWFNFLIYGYLASTMAVLFFPTQNRDFNLILTYAVFAISFLVRPIGSIIFGILGDKHGRQRSLIISLIVMGLATLVIAILPTYKEMGLWSPCLLLLARIVQGVSAGGEYTGTVIYLTETAPKNKIAFWVSLANCTAVFGILLSSGACLLLAHLYTAQEILAYAWRYLYVVGAALSLIGILLRLNLPETPEFKHLKQESRIQKNILGQIIIKHFFSCIELFLLMSFYGAIFQILFIWMPTFLEVNLNYSGKTALTLNTVFMLCYAFLIPLAGFLTDKVAYKKVLLYAACALTLYAVPAFFIISEGNIYAVIVALAIFVILFSAFVPATLRFLIDLFPVSIRFTGISFWYSLALAIFGGTAPLIATGLTKTTNCLLAPGYYILILGLVTLSALNIKSAKGRKTYP